MFSVFCNTDGSFVLYFFDRHVSLGLVALAITTILSLVVHAVSTLDHSSAAHHWLHLLLLRHLISLCHRGEAELCLGDEGHLTDDRVGSLVVVTSMLG